LKLLRARYSTLTMRAVAQLVVPVQRRVVVSHKSYKTCPQSPQSDSLDTAPVQEATQVVQVGQVQQANG